MSATTGAVNSIALTIKATERMNQISGGRDRILSKTSTSGGGLAFPVNTRPTENNVLSAGNSGKGGSLDVTA